MNTYLFISAYTLSAREISSDARYVSGRLQLGRTNYCKWFDVKLESV